MKILETEAKKKFLKGFKIFVQNWPKVGNYFENIIFAEKCLKEPF